MRENRDIEYAIEEYGDMVYRICICQLHTKADSEDAFQDVFLKYSKNEKDFMDEGHRKAWFIRTTINVCHDYCRMNFWKRRCSLEEMVEEPQTLQEKDTRVINALRSLPSKYRDVLYMYYYEGYAAIEISGILNKNVNTVYSILKRGREKLKEKLGGEFNE